ncbi:MAG: TonB-dependent receptor [Mariniphaga sp.]|nr:TonB-dependent receptor [Mariniphaga sp.]
MKKTIFTSVLVAVLSLFSLAAIAKGTIKGKVVDGETNEPLIGTTIVIDGTTVGTVTDFNGEFSLLHDAGDHTIVVSFIGFISTELQVTIREGQVSDVGIISLEADAVGINEVMVLASVAIRRETPVAISSVDPIQIAEKLGTQEYPEILKSTPGVYATRQGGGFGDSRINLRGFDMTNVAVMINGVPVNDMENGWIYWSNWAGLSEFTRSMQVQRGLGASKLSIGSVGGTINIISKTTDAEKGGSLYSLVGNDGYRKTSFSVATGLSENGWAISLSGAHTTGDGWADATQHDGWSYFASVSKRWTNQLLTFTAFGAPQRHGQRRTRQTIEEISSPSKGLRYNPDWGYKDGQVYNLSTNFYHKPQMSLDHYLTISDRTTLATSAYYSFGTGGGTGNYGSNQNAFYEYKKEGLIDFDRIVDENIANGNEGSAAIIRASRNDHNWMGILTNLQYELNDKWEFSGGLDLRHYVGKHFREVVDLMGGDFVLSTEDKNNPNKIAREGDKIGYWNDNQVTWQGIFSQAEYSIGDLSTFLAASISNTGYRRIDYFLYLDSDPTQTTDWVNHMGFVTKGGANYNINEKHNIFGNIGYFETAPRSGSVFISNTNDINSGAKNERTQAIEFGYGYKSKSFSTNINAYYTNWMDKYYSFSVQKPDGNYLRANVEGVNALHQGIELDFKWKPLKDLYVTGMVSLADWAWQNDLSDVPVYDENQVLLTTVNLFIADLKVADAAQTTMALGLDYVLFEGLKFGINYNYYADLYAWFDPIGRGDESKKGVQPWKAPAYGLFDGNVRYNFKIGDFDATIYGNVFNIFDTEYISDATDGKDNDWRSARVYYGMGMTWSTGLKIKF